MLSHSLVSDFVCTSFPRPCRVDLARHLLWIFRCQLDAPEKKNYPSMHSNLLLFYCTASCPTNEIMVEFRNFIMFAAVQRARPEIVHLFIVSVNGHAICIWSKSSPIKHVSDLGCIYTVILAAEPMPKNRRRNIIFGTLVLGRLQKTEHFILLLFATIVTGYFGTLLSPGGPITRWRREP